VTIGQFLRLLVPIIVIIAVHVFAVQCCADESTVGDLCCTGGVCNVFDWSQRNHML